MAMRQDEGQQKLKVITTIDESQEKQHIDPSGQVLLFTPQKVLVPPGFEGFADYLNNRLHRTEQKLETSTEQNRRLANSLEKVIPKFIDQSVNHTCPDIVFGLLPEGKEGDVAIADGKSVPAEALYTMTAGQIAQRVGNDKMSASQMGVALRRLRIHGDSRFHLQMMHGKTPVQCYKPNVINEIYRRVATPEAYGLDMAEVRKIVNRLKPKEALSP
jgi:hypothetical protein